MRQTAKIVFSLLLSALFVWLSLRGVNLGELGSALAGAHPGWIGAALATQFAMHFVRVKRWGLLLEPLTRATFWQLNPLGAVGFMLLMVMPLRLGELARPYLAGEYLGVRKSGAMASVVVERVVDGFAFGLLMILLLWNVPAAGVSVAGAHVSATSLRAGGFMAGGIFGGLAVALVLAYRQRERAVVLLRRTVGLVSPRLAERLAGMLGSFTEGLAVMPSARRIAEYGLLTVLFWGGALLGLVFIGRAFGIELSAFQALAVLTLQVMGAMIPAGPGMIGTTQFFTQLGLALFTVGVAPAVGAAFANTSWAINFCQQVGLGLFFVAAGRVQMTGLLAAVGFGRAAGGPAATPPSPEQTTAAPPTDKEGTPAPADSPEEPKDRTGTGS